MSAFQNCVQLKRPGSRIIFDEESFTFLFLSLSRSACARSQCGRSGVNERMNELRMQINMKRTRRRSKRNEH